jgi:hypothetical protein
LAFASSGPFLLAFVSSVKGQMIKRPKEKDR